MPVDTIEAPTAIVQQERVYTPSEWRDTVEAYIAAQADAVNTLNATLRKAARTPAALTDAAEAFQSRVNNAAALWDALVDAADWWRTECDAHAKGTFTYTMIDTKGERTGRTFNPGTILTLIERAGPKQLTEAAILNGKAQRRD